MRERLQPLKQRWDQLAQRERHLVVVAAALVVVYLLWAVGIHPAWKTMRAAPAQREQAQALVDQIQAMAALAQGLKASAGAQIATQSPPRTMESGVDETTRSLLSAALGESAMLEVQGRFVSIRFEGVSGEQIRQALKLLRSRLRAQLIEAELEPGEEGVRGRLRFEWIAG